MVVLALFAGGLGLARLMRSDEKSGPWDTPLWASWSAGSLNDVCTVGVCVGDTVALPLARPVEAVADLSMPEELGASSVERAWIGERYGMFGTGWATVWDVRLVDGRFVGPLPAAPVEAPRRGHRVELEGGATVRVDDEGRLDEVCLDAALCTAATWSDDALVLQPVLGSGIAGKAKVTLLLDDGLVSRASSNDGRTVTYRYSSGRLDAVTRGQDRTQYEYEAGRLTSIDDGLRRTFTYDGAGRVIAASDLDGGRWTIGRPAPVGGSAADSANSSSRTFEVQSPEGWTRTYRFTHGALVEVVDSDLGVLLRREVVGGRVKVEERPLEGIRSEWVAADELRVQQQQDGGPIRKARFWFDDAGRVVRTQTAEGQTRVRFEGRSERPSQVSGPDGTQTFDYDRRGLLVATEDVDGYRVEVERNQVGQPVTITDGVLRTGFAYDTAGRVTEERSGDAVSSATYGANGLLDSLTTPAGGELDATYDDRGRLQALGEEEAEPATAPSPGPSEDGGSTVETVKRSDGSFEQRYPSGETVVLDDGLRPVKVTVDGRSESRRYDEAGRLVELDLPGGPTYELTHTPAGRVASVTDGTVTTDLDWHGDLLTSVKTSAGSSYKYDYDEAGRVLSATSGPQRWNYTYDEAGRSSIVRGPSGLIQSRWDDQGRPIEVRDGRHTELYRWRGDGLDLTQVDIDDEEVLGFRHDDAGRVIEVSEAESGTAELGYDQKTGLLNSYRLGDADELTLDYDSDGQVTSIESGDRSETWTWTDGQVVKVKVDGQDASYRLKWLAPGLLGDVKYREDHLLRTEVDAAGRPTKIWNDDDLAATLSWDDTGLAKASIQDDPSATFARDDEHRPIRAEVGDERVNWIYEDGALNSIDDGDRTTSFEYSDGRIDRTIHDDDGDRSTITWDPSRARPKKIDTTEGEVAFGYGDGKVTSIKIDDEDQEVRYQDGQVTADGRGRDILDSLFSDAGRYRSALGQSTVGPTAPWIDSLPDELGVSLPEVVTGREVAESAIDNQLPNVPGFLLDDPDDIAKRTAQGLVAASAAGPILAGPDQVAGLGMEVEQDDLSFDFAGAVDAATAEQMTGILAPGPGLVERVVDFGGDLVDVVGGGLRAIQRFVTQSPVGRFILTTGFLVTSFLVSGVCVSVGICALAAAGLWLGETVLSAEPGQGLTSAVVAAVLRPYGDLADSISSGDPLGIALSTATSVATIATVALPLVRQLRPQALSIVCGLQRVVCTSTERFGPAAKHVADAQRNGAPRVLRIDRDGAAGRRTSALRNVDIVPGSDRDEYPFALSSRRRNLSVRHIDPSSNKALGAYVGNQVRGLPDGARFFVLPIA